MEGALTEDDLFRIGLYDLATGLVQQESGASDPMPAEDVIRVVRYLRKRLREWRPSTGWAHERDAALKTYVEAALTEWVRYRLSAWRRERARETDRVSPEPRHDELFWQGVEWLDALGRGER